jgi:hypothetical protein
VSPASFVTSPNAQGEQRKFINPTPGWVGANIFGPDGKPTAVAVEPGGEIWLTEAEERMTAEAPRYAADNPFVKEWDEPVEWSSEGTEVIRTIRRTGTLQLVDEAPRPVASQRFVPARGSLEDLSATRQAMEGLSQPAPQNGSSVVPAAAEEHTESDKSPAPSEHETVKGADVPAAQPPVQGQPSENEVIGTPEAPDANNAAVAAREATAEQPVRDAETFIGEHMPARPDDPEEPLGI